MNSANQEGDGHRAVTRRRTPSPQRLKFFPIFAIIFAVWTCSVPGAGLHEVPRERVRPTHASDHILLKFKTGQRARALAAQGTNDLAALLESLDLPAGAALLRSRYEELLRAEQSNADTSSRAEQVDERFLRLRLPPGMSVEEGLRLLTHHPAVEFVEPDWTTRAALVKPLDPGFSQQWYHLNTISNGNLRADIHTPEAWDITRGSSNVIVGLLDTGLNSALAEFAGRVVPGYNFVAGNTNTADDNFHGTAIASILAATGDNGIGIAGVDWNCKLMPIKVLNQNDAGLNSWFADGLDWARTHGCKVVNLSFAGEPSEVVTRAISDAIAAGVVVVALADNGGWPSTTYPGSLSNVITVGSTDNFDRWAISNSGPTVDVVAPGVQMTLLTLDGSIGSGSGNSASAPLVSGVVALLAAVRPDLTHAMAQTLLSAGADDQLGDSRDVAGRDDFYGWGRLNAYNSVVLARSRLQHLSFTDNGSMRFEWECPPNAGGKKPYRIEVASSLLGPWQRLPSSTNIVYQSGQASWTDTGGSGPEAQRFFRLQVVAE